jgi:hypothetical protein
MGDDCMSTLLKAFGVKMLGTPSTLIEALGKDYAAIVKKVAAAGADVDQFMAAMDAIPVPSVVGVTAAPPAYVVMSALAK